MEKTVFMRINRHLANGAAGSTIGPMVFGNAV
jgi:hypothetical protein